MGRDDDYCEAKWQVIANGRFVEQGRTVRENGLWRNKDVVRNEVSHQSRSAYDSHDHQNQQKRTITEGSGRRKTVRPDDHDEEEEEMESDSERASFAETEEEEEVLRRLRVAVFKPNHSKATIYKVIEELDWRECKDYGDDAEADIWWYGHATDYSVMFSKPGVFAINRLPGISNLTQKVNFSLIIKRMQLLYPNEFNFYPQTWFLPNQYQQFIGESKQSFKKLPKEPKRAMHREVYIIKPNHGSHGIGIYLINEPSEITCASRSAVVQRYVQDPLLIEGYKFDLRMYVVVSRLNPTEIYMCKDGLARFCTVKYERPYGKNLKNMCMHLTNYTLNKQSSRFQQTDSLSTGSKRTYLSIKETLRKEGYNVTKIHRKIVNLCNKVVLAMVPDLRVYENSIVSKERKIRPFQILGFDILLTKSLEPVLLEINASPSLHLGAERETFYGSGIFQPMRSKVDAEVKIPLVRDCLRLVAYGDCALDANDCSLERIFPQPRSEFSHSNVSKSLQKIARPAPQCRSGSHEKGKGERIEMDKRTPSKYHLQPNNNTSKDFKHAVKAVVTDQLHSATGSIDFRQNALLKKLNNFCKYPERRGAPTDDSDPEECLRLLEHRRSLPPDARCHRCGDFVHGTGPGLCHMQDRDREEVETCSGGGSSRNSSVMSLGSESGASSDGGLKQAELERRERSRKKLFRVCESCLRTSVLPEHYPDVAPSSSVVPVPTAELAGWGELSRYLLREEESREAVQRCTILNHAADAFTFFAGVRSKLTMSPNSFRNMVRRCHLCHFHHLPSVDILFLETAREWREVWKHPRTAPPAPTGLHFQGFVDALFHLARAHQEGDNLTAKVEALLTGVKTYMDGYRKGKFRRAPKPKDAQMVKVRKNVYAASPGPYRERFYFLEQDSNCY